MLTADASSHESTILMKLDTLGPMIINTDGSISKIPNWDTFSETEKKNSFRLITQRNKKRLDDLIKMSITAVTCEVKETASEVLAIDSK
jgi:hypothetical protein